MVQVYIGMCFSNILIVLYKPFGGEYNDEII